MFLARFFALPAVRTPLQKVHPMFQTNNSTILQNAGQLWNTCFGRPLVCALTLDFP